MNPDKREPGRRRTGTFAVHFRYFDELVRATEATMHGIIYIIGLIVVVLVILSFFGLR